MFIAQSQPNPDGAVRRSGTQVYRYGPSLFRSSERRRVFVVLGSINISLLRSVDYGWNELCPASHFCPIDCLITRLESPLVVAVAAL